MRLNTSDPAVHQEGVGTSGYATDRPAFAGSLSVNYFTKGDKLMVRYWGVKEQTWSEASEMDLVQAAQRLQLLENQFIADRTEN